MGSFPSIANSAPASSFLRSDGAICLPNGGHAFVQVVRYGQVVRARFALPPLLLALASAAGAPPPLAALGSFQPGAWQVKQISSTSSSSQCLADVLPMLIGGRPATDCSFTAISDSPDTATLTYRCAAGRSGHTVIRRDMAGLYTVDAQGLENGLPFASRTEWRRTGGC